MRVGFRIVLLAASGACAVALASCSGRPATGTYVEKKGNAIALVDLVEGEHGQVVGRMEAAYVKPDGAFNDQGGALSGQRDGKHLSLTLNSAFSTVSATGELHGAGLTLIGPAFSFDLSKSKPEAFQKGVAELRARSAAIVAARVRAEADAKAERERAQAEATAAADRAQSEKVDASLAAQADALVARLSRAEQTLSAAAASFAKVADRVDQGVAAARSAHVGAMRLNQVSIAIGGTLIQVEGQHNQLEAGEQNLSGVIQQQLEADATAHAHCVSLGNSDAALTQACGDLFTRDQKLRAALPAIRSAVQIAEAAYAKDHARIEAAQRRVDELAQRAG